MKYLFFDTETNGLPANWKVSFTDTQNWPAVVQLAWVLCEGSEKEPLSSGNFLIKPKEGFVLDAGAASIHGLTLDRLENDGIPIESAMAEFFLDLHLADALVAHNIDFDIRILSCEMVRTGCVDALKLIQKIEKICTMKSTVDFCGLTGPRGKKWPKLQELHYKLFDSNFDNAHDALADVRATAKCFFNLPAGVVK